MSWASGTSAKIIAWQVKSQKNIKRRALHAGEGSIRARPEAAAPPKLVSKYGRHRHPDDIGARRERRGAGRRRPIPSPDGARPAASRRAPARNYPGGDMADAPIGEAAVRIIIARRETIFGAMTTKFRRDIIVVSTSVGAPSSRKHRKNKSHGERHI